MGERDETPRQGVRNRADESRAQERASPLDYFTSRVPAPVVHERMIQRETGFQDRLEKRGRMHFDGDRKAQERLAVGGEGGEDALEQVIDSAPPAPDRELEPHRPQSMRHRPRIVRGGCVVPDDGRPVVRRLRGEGVAVGKSTGCERCATAQ